MPNPKDRQDGEQPSGWALDQAGRDLFDEKDSAVVVAYAWELMCAAQKLDDERHDQDDDPDQGGES